jgi:hypothetical protein
MAAAIGAIKGFLHFFTDDLAQPGESRHVVTVLDVLEPRGLRG